MAVNLDKQSAVAWANRGAALELLGKPKDARRNYTKALNLDNSNALARDGLTRVNRSG